MKSKLKVGDQVRVISGKDKGKEGKILHVHADVHQVVVDGIALAKRHLKGGRGEIGSIVERPRKIDASNVMLIDPSTKKPTRVKRELRDGKLVRVTVKGNVVVA